MTETATTASDANPSKDDATTASTAKEDVDMKDEDKSNDAAPATTTPETPSAAAAPPPPPPSEQVMDLIAERLSFFFSDANIRSDRFMQKHLVREEEEDFGGTISAGVLMKFKSVQQHIPADYTTNGGADAIVYTVQEHASLKDFLYVTKEKDEEDGTLCIGRVVPMKKSQWNDNIPLSLHVSNIPMKNGRYSVGIHDIKPLFEPYGKVMLVKLKWHTPYNNNNNNNGNGGGNHYKNNARSTPSGTCLIEYSTKEECHTALKALAIAAVPTPDSETKEGHDDKAPSTDGDAATTTTETKDDTGDKKDEKSETLVTKKPETVLELMGSVLTVESLEKWIEQRKAEKASRKDKTNKKDGKDNDNGRTPNKKRKADDTDADDKAAGAATPLPEFKIDWNKNCVISLKGLNAETCDREAIRAVLDTAGFEKTVYADYSRGQDYGAIRFTNTHEEKDEADILKKRTDFCDALNAGTIVIGGNKVESAKLLQGEEEELYWKNFMDFKTKQLRSKAQERSNNNNKKRRR